LRVMVALWASEGSDPAVIRVRAVSREVRRIPLT
jgi:hypothetical protein